MFVLCSKLVKPQSRINQSDRYAQTAAIRGQLADRRQSDPLLPLLVDPSKV
jgi:hypothetical protein